MIHFRVAGKRRGRGEVTRIGLEGSRGQAVGCLQRSMNSIKDLLSFALTFLFITFACICVVAWMDGCLVDGLGFSREDV